MRINQKNLQYILLLLIVIIAACAYKFGYLTFSEKAEAVATENKVLEARLNELNEKETHRTEYAEVIANSDIKIAEILSKYGSGNTPEKSILFITKLEEAAKAEIPSVTFYDVQPSFISTAITEEGLPKVVGYSTEMAISYTTTYKGLKKMIDFINGYNERMNVLSFTAVYNQETGGITGSMNIGLYSVSDANHAYVDPEASGVRLGTSNIFNSVD